MLMAASEALLADGLAQVVSQQAQRGPRQRPAPPLGLREKDRRLIDAERERAPARQRQREPAVAARSVEQA